jgi:hypothetical protein
MLTRVSIALALSSCFVTTQALAQTTRTEQIEQEKSVKAANVQPEEREKGDVLITKLEHLFAPQPPAIRLTLGDFRPGAGFAAGLAYATPVRSALWTTSAAWSVKNFKQAESTLESPALAGDRLRVSPLVRWNDAPDLTFFGLGNNSSSASEVSYGLRSIEAGAHVQARAARWFRYGGSVAYLSAHSSDGAGPEPSVETLANEGAPGLGSAPAWVHSSAYAAVDTRESPGYTQRGGLYSATFHRYADRGGQFSFDRTEIDIRQFIPLLHNNWVIALQGRADLASSAQGQVIPYFMLPSIGGRDTLPGYEEYRFTDRNTLLLRSELRWTPTPLVDMAVFLGQGTVAPGVAALDLHDMKRDWGFGARLHGSTLTALRLEITHSVEGWRYNVAHSVSF